MLKLFVKSLLVSFLWLLLLLPLYAYAEFQTTSGTSATTIIDRARYVLDYSSASGTTDNAYSDTAMLAFLNEGMRDIARKTECLQDIENITLTANTLTYNMGSSGTPYVVSYVQYIDEDGTEKSLDRSDPGKVGENQSSIAVDISPTNYYEYKGQISVFPKLTSISGTTPENINVFFSYITTDIGLNDNVTIPAKYDNALFNWVVAHTARMDGKYGLAKSYMADYLTEIALSRKDNEMKDEKK